MMKYEKYKDSESKWLGDIPVHWEVLRLKDITKKIGSGVTPKGGSSVYVKEGVTFLRSQNVYDDGLRLNDVSHIDEETHKKMRNSQLRPFDVLLNITGASIGRTCIVPENLTEANINQHILYIRTHKRWVNYLSNYLKTHSVKEYINSIQAGSSKEGLNMNQTLCISYPFPPLPEQQAIAQYLDKKTNAIDSKVKLLEQKIDFYKELRKSLINNAVTKGLDKSVTLKITEIGIEVPITWNRYRLKDIGKLYSGLSGKSGDDFRQDNHPDNKGFIPFTNIAANTYISKDNIGKVVVGNSERQNEVKKGDIFFLMSSEGYEDIGKSSVLNLDLEQTYLNSFCKGYRLKSKKFDSHFINYLLQSDSYRQLLIVEGKGFTRINLKMEKVNDFFVHLPSTKEEQTKIAEYLDKKTTTVDSIAQNITDQIDRIKELRKSLINDVVTGKIKVVE